MIGGMHRGTPELGLAIPLADDHAASDPGGKLETASHNTGTVVLLPG